MLQPSIPDGVPIRQAKCRKTTTKYKPRKRASREYDILARFAKQPGAPTLQQAQEAAAGILARLLVAYFREQGQGFSQSVVTEGGER